MLVLTRKTGQKLIIDNDIEVVILETRGESVKIGINAPKHVSVFREEVYEEIRRTNCEAREGTASAADLSQVLHLMEPNNTLGNS